MYYGYIRVSTETQAEKGGGLDVQKRAIEKYASDNGITIEKIFCDAGVSGTQESRPELDALLLETIVDGDVIIVHNTSRLWRSIFAQATVMKAVIKENANIRSIDEPSFDVYRYQEDPENFILCSLMGMLDQWERMVIARKLARGRAAKAAKGDKPAGVAPFGYRYTADKKGIEINETEAQAVRMMFTEGQKGYSLRQIAAVLNGSGIPTRRGNEWSAGNVQAILKNRFYLGEIVHDSKAKRKAPGYAPEYHKGNHTPLISKVQFGKVQAQLEKRKR